MSAYNLEFQPPQSEHKGRTINFTPQLYQQGIFFLPGFGGIRIVDGEFPTDPLTVEKVVSIEPLKTVILTEIFPGQKVALDGADQAALYIHNQPIIKRIRF